MDISFDAELDGFRDEVRAFLDEHWTKGGREGEDRRARERRFRLAAIEAGYLYRHVPVRYGGSEQPADGLRAEIIRQEFTDARAPADFRIGSGASLLTPTLLEKGTDWQKETFIQPALLGDKIWCQGYSEPNAGSDLASLRTKAELVDGEWVINGQKIWTSYAFAADYIFLLARTEPDAPKHKGISYLLMDMKQPGITIRPLKQVTGKSEFCEVFFDDARTPADWIVGERGEGWAVSKTTLRHERTSMRGLNFQEALFAELVRMAKRTPRGNGFAIDEPDIRQRLAAIEGSIAAMRYSAYRQFSMEAAGADAGLFPSLRKLYSSNISAEQVRLGRDLIDDEFLLMVEPGDRSASRNSKWVHTWFSSMILAIAGGSSNIQRNIIAERGLGLPRDKVDA